MPSTKASTVPSPPSAKGIIFISELLSTFNIAVFIALAASIEVKLPFKESIEITIFIATSSFYQIISKDFCHFYVTHNKIIRFHTLIFVISNIEFSNLKSFIKIFLLINKNISKLVIINPHFYLIDTYYCI